MVIIVGVEGGATASRAVLMNRDGHILSLASGPHTNLTLLGADEMARRITKLISDCLIEANLPGNCKINYLGLSISGINSAEEESHSREAIMKHWEGGIENLVVCNDTVGSLRTADDAGIVLIAGTGSNCRLIHEDLKFHRVGGWGNVFGDEGSAFGIVRSGIKKLIDHEEGIFPQTCSLGIFKSIVLDYFNIETMYELVPIFHQNFEKSRVAMLCPLLSAAAEMGDPFCRSLFTEAGYFLGRMVATMARKCEQSILDHDEGLPVVCVGGVWASWYLLKDGFLKGLQPHFPNDIQIKKICLKQLKVTAAYGAAVIASELGDTPIKPDYESNYDIFYHL